MYNNYNSFGNEGYPVGGVGKEILEQDEEQQLYLQQQQ